MPQRTKPKKLSAEFYQRDTVTVARELLGCTLVHVINGRRLAGRIVETEAYLGVADEACHSFGDRRTTRTESMYLEGGHAYVYLIYGMHYCFNVVTQGQGCPEAVLIRAIEPTQGLEEMRERRKVKSDRDLTSGPGKLCRALGIDRSCDGVSLDGASLFIEADMPLDAKLIASSPRVGVDYAGEAAKWLMRFSVLDNPFVSRKPR